MEQALKAFELIPTPLKAAADDFPGDLIVEQSLQRSSRAAMEFLLGVTGDEALRSLSLAGRNDLIVTQPTLIDAQSFNQEKATLMENKHQ